MYKGYIGEKKIQSAGIVPDKKTPGGLDLVAITFESDGKMVEKQMIIPKKMADRIVTEEPVDASALRDLRITPLCEDILTMMLEYGMLLDEKDYVFAVIGNSLKHSLDAAEEALWGTDNKSVLDIQDVIDRKKITVNDVINEAGDK